MKVHIRPTPKEIKPNNGIGRVVHAQYKHLGNYGVELVDSKTSADVYAGHTQRFDMPRIDCLHCHGLYWSGDVGREQYGSWHHGVNYKIVEAAREAVAISVPSEWVAMPFKRDMRISPQVIGHGIEFAEWKPGKSKGYLLWNKNRDTDVCDPAPAWELAQRGAQVISTFGVNKQAPPTLKVTGVMPAREMREMVRHAEIYLATTRETFGIGTLEAMACGKPVLGYAWGGTADIVRHGVDGWLVAPGDLDALYAGIEIIRSRYAEISEAAREAARAYDWPEVIQRYAHLYHRIVEQVQTEQNGVSVIITCHNYGEYVGEAIESAQRQTVSPAEIVVVDDGSTDDSIDVIRRYADDPRVKIIEQRNKGVAAARTAGIQASTQEYIVCLDADDKIEPRFIEVLQPALHADRSLGIVYSGLSLNYPDGGQGLPDTWPPEFNWTSQSTVSNPPSNCIPSACLFRREMWERAGSHRQEYAPGEDAEFWTRGLSVGFKAKHVTQVPLFWYRLHAESASRVKKYRPIDDRLPWMRDRQYPMAAPLENSIPAIRSYADPIVSVVIPVGKGHARYLPDALDSLIGQSMRAWEVIVVDDTHEMKSGKEKNEISFTSEFDFGLLRRYPFIRYEMTQVNQRGAAGARNAGLNLTRAPLVLFLDADDLLLPSALSTMLKAYVRSGGRYVYTDHYDLLQRGSPEAKRVKDYSQFVWMDNGLHSVTALLPREWVERLGGFDASMSGWEEGDLFTRMAIEGYCGAHVPEPLLIYRTYSGTRRGTSLENSQALISGIKLRYHDYITGARPMASCCGGNGKTIREAQAIINRMPVEVKSNGTKPEIEEQMVRMEYTGGKVGAVTFFGSAGREYRGGNNSIDRFASVHPEDVARLEKSGQWRRVVVLPVTVKAGAGAVQTDDSRMQWDAAREKVAA